MKEGAGGNVRPFHIGTLGTGSCAAHNRAMMFAKHLRQGIREGSITCSIRIWQHPHAKVGGIYPMEDGHIVVESIRQIGIGDITGELARQSGFKGVVDLLKTAKHGSGTNVYLIQFEYIAPK